VDELGAAGRYLSPPADRAAAWRTRIATTAAPRVGLAWSVLARDAHAFVTRHKSVPASVFAPVLATPDTSLFTLQPGPAGDPGAFGANAPRIVDMRTAIGDFADTAALIDTLDLVISADTAVAHVAGPWANPCGCSTASIRAGAGGSRPRIRPGIRRCASFASIASATGTA